MLEEGRRQFVVLAIGLVGVDGDRALAQHRDLLLEALAGRFGTAGGLFGEPLRAHPADAVAEQGVGYQSAFGQAEKTGGGGVAIELHRIDDGIHGASLDRGFGNHGNNIGVVCW